MLSVGVSAGHDFLVGPVTISPNARLSYIDATVDEFRESGASGLDLIYEKQDFSSAAASIGARDTGAWNLGWIVLLPHFRADAVWEFQDDVNAFGVRFANDPFAGTASPTPPIIVTSEKADQSFMIFAVGMAAQLRYGISAYIEYQTFRGSSSSTCPTWLSACASNTASARVLTRPHKGVRSSSVAAGHVP